jgi:hypothetical protein
MSVISPPESGPLAGWAFEELKKLEDKLQQLDHIRFAKTYVEPAKLTDGLIVYADGSEWDPGSGIGLYRYEVGTGWEFLG